MKRCCCDHVLSETENLISGSGNRELKILRCHHCKRERKIFIANGRVVSDLIIEKGRIVERLVSSL